MSSILGTHNPSILAIPAYYIISLVPHSYALNVATQGKLLTWDNRNPRSTELKAKLKASLPAETYAKYERLEACHANGFEVLPANLGMHNDKMLMNDRTCHSSLQP